MDRRAPLTRSKPLRVTSTLQRTSFKRRARKQRPGHAPAYLAACKGQPCFLNLPGCRQIPEDETVVPAHRNQGKGMGLKVDDSLTVPACHRCHTLYDQSGIDREYKRAAWDWAYTRWEPVRAALMQKDEISTANQAETHTRKKDGIPSAEHLQTGGVSSFSGHP